MRKLLPLLLLLFALPAKAQTYGQAFFYSGGGGTTPAISASTTKVIYAADPAYGGKFDWKREYDCTFNTTTTVVCPKGAFTSADVGKIEFGTQTLYTNGTGLLVATPVVVPQGTINSVTNATTVVVSIAANANCTPTFQNNLCAFAWGTQDDGPAVILAQTAAWSSGNTCLPIVLPAGAFATASGGVGALASGAANACYNQADFDQNGPEMYGQGQNSTTIIPLPSFNFATCTFGTSGTACFGGAPNGVYHDFEINGLGNSLPSTTNAVNLFELDGNSACTGAVMRNVHLAGWALQSTSTVGLTVQAACDVNIHNSLEEAFGTVGCLLRSSTAATNLSLVGMICFGNGGTAAAGGELQVQLNGGGLVASTGGYYGGCLTGTCYSILVNSGSGSGNNFSSTQDTIFSQTTQAQNTVSVQGTNAVKVNFIADNISQLGALAGAGQALLCQNSGAGTLITFADTFISAGAGANNRLFDDLNANCVIQDVGGNTFVDGGLASTFTGPFVPYYNSVYPSTLQVATFVVGATGTGACATITTQTGNKNNGSLKCTGTTGASTIVLTPGTTATNGWNCKNSQDITTPADTAVQTGINTGTCTLTFTAVAQNDVVEFNLQQF